MKITDNTTGVLREVDRRSTKALNESAVFVKTVAKRDVVVKTGKLQRSIDAEMVEEAGKKKIVIGSPLNYAPIIETEQPYLRPALHSNLNFIRKVFKAK